MFRNCDGRATGAAQDALASGIDAGDLEAAEAMRYLVETVTVSRDPSRLGGVEVVTHALAMFRYPLPQGRTQLRRAAFRRSAWRLVTRVRRCRRSAIKRTPPTRLGWLISCAPAGSRRRSSRARLVTACAFYCRNLKRKFLDIENSIRHSLQAFGIRFKNTGRGGFEAAVRPAVAGDKLTSELMDAMLIRARGALETVWQAARSGDEDRRPQ